MPHKLLLADDSVTIQRVIELTFANQDVQVLTAADGEQAIATIQTERPDVVLADIGLPRRSGYDVAAFVKGEPGLAHIPVLLLTGAFEPVDEGRARGCGCDGVLVKPFEPQHVIARVRELLDGASQRAARPSGSAARAVSDVPRPADRLALHRPTPSERLGEEFDLSLPAAPDTSGVSEKSLEDYFDRLDAAFANISTPAADGPAPIAGQPEAAPRRDSPVMAQDLDWFDSPQPQAARAEQPRPSAPDPHPVAEAMPATFASPPVAPGWPLPQAAPIDPPSAPTVIAPRPQLTRVLHVPETDSGSIIADAFSALLAVEQGEPGALPVRIAAIGGGPAAVTDELIEELTRRVIERLGPDAARDLVGDVVSRIAERLVREEIKRIRNKHV